MKESISRRASNIEYSGIRRMVGLAAGMKDVISFALGEPDYDTPVNIKKAAIKAIEAGFTHYTSTAGLPELRQAVAEKLHRENRVDYDPQTEIVITVGACEACYSAIMSTVDFGDEVIVTDPSFVFYAPTVILAGGKPVFVPIEERNDFRPNLDEIEKLITPKTKIIWINSPNNPTGSILLESDAKRIAEIAKKYDLLVMTDEVYEKFVYDGNKHCNVASLPEMKERTLVINALSKTYAMTGWRVGYVAANERLNNRLHIGARLARALSLHWCKMVVIPIFEFRVVLRCVSVFGSPDCHESQSKLCCASTILKKTALRIGFDGNT